MKSEGQNTLKTLYMLLFFGFLPRKSYTLLKGTFVMFNVFLIRILRWTKCERENKFKFIFTPVYWGEKINLNSFHSCLLVSENKFEFIFSPQ